MSSVLPPYLTYLEKYGLLICSTHQRALHKSQVIDHITKTHHDTGFTDAILHPLHLMNLDAAHHMLLSDQPIDPIPLLQAPQPGFQCRQCGQVRRSQQRLRKHLYQQHHLQGYHAQHQETATCWTQALAASAYLFTVTQEVLSPPIRPTRKPSRERSVPRATQGPVTQRTSVQTLPLPHPANPSHFLARFNTIRQNLRRSRVIQSTGQPYEARGFFSNSQYPAFLHGRDAKDLEALFTLDNPDRMTWLSAIIYHLLNQGSSFIQRTSTQSLGALNSFSQDPLN